jgi:hypothetical protein
MRTAITLPKTAINRPMFVDLNSLSIDDLESWRWTFNFLLVVSTLAVCAGVYFERDGNPEDVKKYGWKLVLRGVAFEFLFAILLWQTDSAINTRSAVDIASLHERAAKAELELAKLKLPRIIKPQQTKDLIAALIPYAGSKFWIIVEKSEIDVASEQQNLADQLLGIFSASRLIKDYHALKDDLSKVDPPTTPISNRGCFLATADDATSVELGLVVSKAFKSAELECELNAFPGMVPSLVSIEIGLR